jgi:hypothetical protein
MSMDPAGKLSELQGLTLVQVMALDQTSNIAPLAPFSASSSPARLLQPCHSKSHTRHLQQMPQAVGSSRNRKLWWNKIKPRLEAGIGPPGPQVCMCVPAPPCRCAVCVGYAGPTPTPGLVWCQLLQQVRPAGHCMPGVAGLNLCGTFTVFALQCSAVHSLSVAACALANLCS